MSQSHHWVFLIAIKIQCTHSEPALGTSALKLFRLLQKWAPHDKSKEPNPTSPEPRQVRQGDRGGTSEEVKATIPSSSSAGPFLLPEHIFSSFPQSSNTVTYPDIKSMRVCKLSFQKFRGGTQSQGMNSSSRLLHSRCLESEPLIFHKKHLQIKTLSFPAGVLWWATRPESFFS